MTDPGWGPRQRVGAVLAPLSFVVLWFAPLPLETQPHRLAAVFAAVVIAWISEVLPIAVTALLIAPLLVATGITDAQTAFAPYADPLLFLFIGGFFLARAMSRHKLDQRIATGLVNLRWVRGRAFRVRVALMCAGMFLSMWISNTATAAILMPILLGGFSDDEDASGPLLGVGYACSVGGLGTLVGSPPNGITVRLLAEHGETFGFVEWMMIGLPAALVTLVLVVVITARMHPAKGAAALPQVDRPWSRGEKATAAVFGLAVFGWMLTGLWKATGSETGSAVEAALPGGAVAIIAASFLFMLRDDEGAPVLPWDDAVKIDWGIILLFGGGISLGQQMFDTGFARALSEGFVAFTGIESLWTLTAVVTFFTIFFTEVCSNTASATMLVPLVIAIADRMEVSAVPPALAVGLAASCAFMLPIATGPNAIIYGTGRIPLPSMMRTGIALNIACALAILLLLFLLLPLYGWT